MADGLQIEATGLIDAQRMVTQMAVRMSDLEKPLKNIAQEIEKRTDDSFRYSRSQFGEPFKPLAPSTVAGRIRKLRGANRRNKAGKLTAGAHRMREKLTAPGGMKPLIDTARMKNSQHVVVDSPTSIRWSAVGYLGPHMTGGQRNGKLGMPPQRNPTVFVKSGGGDFDFLGGASAGWKLDASMSLYFTRAIDTYVRTGKVGV